MILKIIFLKTILWKTTIIILNGLQEIKIQFIFVFVDFKYISSLFCIIIMVIF
jgi:hypothetical protein